MALAATSDLTWEIPESRYFSAEGLRECEPTDDGDLRCVLTDGDTSYEEHFEHLATLTGPYPWEDVVCGVQDNDAQRLRLVIGDPKARAAFDIAYDLDQRGTGFGEITYSVATCPSQLRDCGYSLGPTEYASPLGRPFLCFDPDAD